MKKLYAKMMTLVIMLLALNGVGNTSFAQESGKKANWKGWHFTSEAEYLQHQNGGTRYGGNFQETDPPTGNVRFPAEFEPMQGVIIAYPYDGFGLPTDMIADITESCMTYVIVASDDQRFAERELRGAGADLNNVVFWNMSIDSYWARDFGPWYIFNDNEPAIVDFVYNRNRANDDDAPINIANNYQHLPLYGMNLIHTGGNMMQDGRGVGVSDELVYNENYEEGSDYHGSGSSATPQLNLHYSHEQINAIMKSYLNIEPYHVTADPLGQYIAHVDCWGKFLAPDKILVARMPQSDARYQDYEEIAQYFATTNCCYGYPYKVYRVDELSSADNGTLAPYTNSLILNDKVYVPLGSDNTYNNNAIAVYQEAMPGYEIIGVSSPRYSPWLNSDAIHCRTRGIMDFNMMFVDHRNVIHGEDIAYQDYYTVSADLIAYSGAAVTTAQLVYRVNEGEWNYVNMTNTDGDTYTANIPGVYDASIEYYITATDANGNTGSQPMMGAYDPHGFSIEQNQGVSVLFEASETEILVGDQVLFTDLSSSLYDLTAWDWEFEGATPNYSVLQNPVITYNVPGTYDVTLTVTNANGIAETLVMEDFITVTEGSLDVLMGSTSSVYSCNARFYDSGGSNGNYGNNERNTITFYPGTAGGKVQVAFSSFEVENRYDYLYVYDGVSRQSSLIGKYTSTNMPPVLTASNVDGALTFYFTSDNSMNKSGWEAQVSCLQMFDVVCEEVHGGVIEANPHVAVGGATINLLYDADDNSTFVRWIVKDQGGNDVEVVNNHFIMPYSDVTVSAEFEVVEMISMHNGSETVRAARFFDSGGANANYRNNENYVLTFYPAEAGEVVNVSFSKFSTESRYDYLYIYDGTSTDARLIATLSGSSANTYQATNNDGALTFKFVSDYSGTKSGWAAEVTCVEVPSYDIILQQPVGGTISASQTTAHPGARVNLRYVLNDGYVFNGWSLTPDIVVEEDSFVMPDDDVTVTASMPNGSYHTYYKQITSMDELVDGETYIIVNANSGNVYVMGSDNGDGYRNAVSARVQNANGVNSLELNDSFSEFVLGPAYSFSGSRTMYEEGVGYLAMIKSSSNSIFLTVKENLQPNCSWTFAVDNNGEFTAYANSYSNSTNRRRIQYSQRRYQVGVNQGSFYMFVKVTEAVAGRGSKGTCDVQDTVAENTNIYPNPTQGNVTIEAAGMNHVSVFNINGQMLYDMDVDADNLQLNMAEFGSGMFLVRVVTADGVATQRVVVKR